MHTRRAVKTDGPNLMQIGTSGRWTIGQGREKVNFGGQVKGQ